MLAITHFTESAVESKPEVRRNKGFVRSSGNGFYIDRKKKIASLIPNEIILQEMEGFFQKYYKLGGEGRMLDVGAGLKPYAPVYSRYFSECISIDVPYSLHDLDVDFYGPADNLPFEDATYDCVLCTEVLEHLPDPLAAMREISRVLKPGGHAFVTTPFLVSLHEMPYDFYRYTPSALKDMAEKTGLTTVSIEPKGEYLGVALSMIQFPITKFWHMLSRLTRIPFYTPRNPLVYLSVTLPQILYLVVWRRASKRNGKGLLGKYYNRFKYITLGYVTILSKGSE